jgi:hypothetical protein
MAGTSYQVMEMENGGEVLRRLNERVCSLEASAKLQENEDDFRHYKNLKAAILGTAAGAWLKAFFTR